MSLLSDIAITFSQAATAAWQACLPAAVILGIHLVKHEDAPVYAVSAEVSPLLGSIPDAVFMFDTRGQLLDCNSLAEALCDRTRQDLSGISIAELNALLSAKDEFDRPVTPPSMGVNRAIRGEIVRNVRRVFRCPKDDRIVETLTSASPICSPSQEVAGVLLIVRDVTEVVQLQQQLADWQRHKEIGEMAAGLAHDFRNVLDTIVHASALLEVEQNGSRPQPSAYFDMIRNAVMRGVEIIDRVHDYLRAGSGKRTEVDIRQILQDVLDLTYPLWRRHGPVSVTKDLQEVAPVCANASDLRRVFTNLIINALEAMPGGGQLKVRCEMAGQHVRAIVSDTGEGIQPEHQKKLFVPYFTTKPDGTGLGLSSAQRIVTSLSGSIRCFSEVGKGSSFVIDLPAIAEEKKVA